MNTLLARTVGLFGGGLIIALPLLASAYSGGAPVTFDGGASDARSCASCHSLAPVNTGTGSVTITAPSTYVAGQPVEITISVDNTTEPEAGGAGARQGFEVAVRMDDAARTPVGTFDLGGSTVVRHAEGNPQFATHTQEGNQQSSWTVTWVPPTDTPPQALTIYAAGNAANGDFSTSGDYVYLANQPLALVTAGENGPVASGVELGTVSPQPVRARAQALLTLREPGQIAARLVDGRGRTVRTLASESRPAGESPVTFDASGLAAGAYFLVVDTDAGRRTARVMVAR